MDVRGIGLPGGKRVVKMPEGSGLPRPKMNGLPSRGLSGAGDNKVVEPVVEIPEAVEHPAEGSSDGVATVNDDVDNAYIENNGSMRGAGLPGRGLPKPNVAGHDGGIRPMAKATPVHTVAPVHTVVDDVSDDVDALINGVPVAGRGNVPSLPVVHEPKGAGLPGRKTASDDANGRGVRLPLFNKPAVVVPSPMVDAPIVDAPVDRVPAGLPAPKVTNPAAGSGNHGGVREPKRRVTDKSPLAGAERWDDADIPDTHLGLNAEVMPPKVVKKRKAKFALTERDIEIITLCARYRFAYREQIQHYFQSENVRNRLTRLADEGLLRKDMVTQNQALWLPMQAGLDVADLDLSHIERGRYSATSIAHSVGLLNLGIEFEKGWENLLMEDVWPNFNRRGQQGEMVITEREITNSFNRLKGIAKGDGSKQVDVPREILKLRNDALASGSGVETREGMAGLFVSFYDQKTHTPDMVIARPRNPDGSSNHIAIELELSPKAPRDLIRILRSFKSDPMFKSVVYFTHKRSINNLLTEINNNHVGLTEEQFKIFKYNPRNNSIPFWG